MDERRIAEIYCKNCRQFVGVLYERKSGGRIEKRCISKICKSEESCGYKEKDQRVLSS